jgi:hypothetical protein
VRAHFPEVGCSLVLSTAVVAAALLAGGDAGASEPLFERFNLKIEGSWVALDTRVRLDSKTLGKGTTLSFEDDLNLDSDTIIPSVAFEWQVGRKHRLAARWQRIDRGSSAQALSEIQWGDQVIPIDARVLLAFDIEQVAADYTYFPWVKDGWAAGFGLGVRVLDIFGELRWDLPNFEAGGADAADATGPLPYINFEYRRLLGERWRLHTGLGWLYVKVGDVDGGQWLADLSLEYLLGRHFSLGAGANYSSIDVDWDAREFPGAVDLDISDVSVFARLRF